MKNKSDRDEFEVFMGGVGKAVPSHLNKEVTDSIDQIFMPSHLSVFFSCLVVHLFAGSFTLFFCPQFGVGPFGGWFNSMEYVMPFGTIVCALFCGILFLGTTAIAMHLVFDVSKLEVLEEKGVFYFSLLGAVSLAVFMILGNLNGSAMSVGNQFIVVWFLGGVFFSATLFKLLYRMKLQA